jgi:hypothetical protein
MGKLWKDPPFLMGKSTISMAIFNSFLYVYQRVNHWISLGWFFLRTGTGFTGSQRIQSLKKSKIWTTSMDFGLVSLYLSIYAHSCSM